ncbi:hypothetical protein P154DRAFT_597914 [Amniculicola lignicola CBS 123094]|uniref:Uncharacterized protein n=1 Tax=Amniculicola lignicola CBS 123094 TaxID=1392246 RepID=A0A6A5WFY0_9PLEO|nr:hypothetical protein P154DRAFT_597914 [Amniculicola lignicola CBS 123094]
MPPYTPFNYPSPSDRTPLRPPPPPSYRDVVTGKRTPAKPRPTRNPASTYSPPSTTTTSWPSARSSLAEPAGKRPLSEYAVGAPWSRDRRYCEEFEDEGGDRDREGGGGRPWGFGDGKMGGRSMVTTYSSLSGRGRGSGDRHGRRKADGSSLKGEAVDFVPGKGQHRMWRDRKDEWDPEFWG